MLPAVYITSRLLVVARVPPAGFSANPHVTGPAKSDASREDKAWQNAVQDFQQSLTQMAAQWGWVSQSEHQKALDKCAALEKKIIQLQRTIKDLQDLLDREGSGHAKLFQHLKDAMEEQSDQFHTLMESIHIAYKDNS